MTGPEHYYEAERLLRDQYRTDRSIAEAQVHATLALAAATAMGAPVDGEEHSGLPSRDAEAWFDVAGVQSPKEGRR
ncbi:hypothetical protein [Streptomyces longispororuber]|uniref:hypothetical protein n=1 Tax=Streptomyces longispororuber TaxID=68230 RepID=UPI0036FA7A5D